MCPHGKSHLGAEKDNVSELEQKKTSSGKSNWTRIAISNIGCVSLGGSRSGFVIQDHSDHMVRERNGDLVHRISYRSLHDIRHRKALKITQRAAKERKKR